MLMLDHASRMNLAIGDAIAPSGMVAAQNPLAVEAGLDILRRGGNAVDAAVCAAFVMGVVDPANSGIGGGGIMLVYRADRSSVEVLDYAGQAPASAAEDVFPISDGSGTTRFGWREVEGNANVVGHRAAAIPGQVRGLAQALERHGSLSLGDALEPAIRLAHDGLSVSERLVLYVTGAINKVQRFTETMKILCPSGRIPIAPSAYAPRESLVQRELARTLSAIAEHGSDVFYEGWVADAVVREMAAHGGLIGSADLSCYTARIGKAQLSKYRGLDVAGAYGASACFTSQQVLGMLDLLSHTTPYLSQGARLMLHIQSEVFRRAFADRFAFGGDPAFSAVPYAELLSEEYARARISDIDPEKAAERVAAGDPVPGLTGTNTDHLRNASTNHICVVDKDRNMVSVTQTLADAFGCGVTVAGTGIILNNSMQWFNPSPGTANSVRPGKVGMSNMSPLLLLADGAPAAAVGASGGARIIGAVCQVVENLFGLGLSPQESVGRPRIDYSDGVLLADARFDDDVLTELRNMGHVVEAAHDSWYSSHFAKPLVIKVDRSGEGLRGGVDALHGAAAAGH